MEITKNDLSADHSKLDFMAMHRTAQAAFALARDEIIRLTADLYPFLTPKERQTRQFYHAASRIKPLAEIMAIAAETYHTLNEAISRTEIEIINKPEEKD